MESPDLPPGIRVPDVHLPSDAGFKPDWACPAPPRPGREDHHVAGTRACTVPNRRGRTSIGPLAKIGCEPFDLRLIPYFAWSNRGRSAMSVWIPVVLMRAKPCPNPTSRPE